MFGSPELAKLEFTSLRCVFCMFVYRANTVSGSRDYFESARFVVCFLASNLLRSFEFPVLPVLLSPLSPAMPAAIEYEALISVHTLLLNAARSLAASLKLAEHSVAKLGQKQSAAVRKSRREIDFALGKLLVLRPGDHVDAAQSI